MATQTPVTILSGATSTLVSQPDADKSCTYFPEIPEGQQPFHPIPLLLQHFMRKYWEGVSTGRSWLAKVLGLWTNISLCLQIGDSIGLIIDSEGWGSGGCLGNGLFVTNRHLALPDRGPPRDFRTATYVFGRGMPGREPATFGPGSATQGVLRRRSAGRLDHESDFAVVLIPRAVGRTGSVLNLDFLPASCQPQVAQEYVAIHVRDRSGPAPVHGIFAWFPCTQTIDESLRMNQTDN